MNTLTQFFQYFISPAIVGAILYWLLKMSFNLGRILNTLEETTKDTTHLKKDVKLLLQNINIVKTHLNIVKTHLVTSSGLDANLFSSNNPLKLLPKGKKILKQSSFKKAYKQNEKWFLNQASNFKTDSLVNIDKTAIKVMDICKTKNKFINYDQVAFENGITTDVLLKVLSIFLRDELAKKLLT